MKKRVFPAYFLVSLIFLIAAIPISVFAGSNGPVSLEITGLPTHQAFDEARINIFVKDSQGNPVPGGSGDITIIFPDNTVLINKEPISEIGSGQYYFTFTAPNAKGTFTTLVSFNSNLGSGSGAFSFFVNPFDWFGILINSAWVIFIVVSVMFGQKILTYQIVLRGERFLDTLEGMTAKGKKYVMKSIPKSAAAKSKNLKEEINNFLEFFVITPVNLDPYGIVPKLEHIMNMEEDRFKYFVEQIAPGLDSEARSNLMMGLSATIGLHEITKVIRHYVEMVKKTGNLQFALMLQMFTPLLERIAKSLLYGTESFVNGWPIGDGIGSMVAARMADAGAMKEVDGTETVLASKSVAGHRVFIMKAKGPGGRVGKLGKSAERIVRQNKVAKIITIDASAKLEGEKTGTVAEGVGVAIGGMGVDRSYIEDVAVKKKIPLDSIIIKMSQEEAIQPIVGETLASMPRVLKIVEERIKATKGRGAVLVVGVGNTCGVGNSKREAEKAEQLARKVIKIVKKREKELKELEKKRRWKRLLLGE